jgi:hypothetical protein
MAIRRPPASAVALAAALSLLTGCGSDNPEQPETGSDASDIRPSGDLEDPYDGPYTEDFHDDVEAYAGQEVTLEAAVAEVYSDRAFTVTGPEDADIEPLLVVTDEAVEGLEQGSAVTVAATPHDEFEIEDVEEQLGTDLPEQVDEWEGEAYLAASRVQASATS